MLLAATAVDASAQQLTTEAPPQYPDAVELPPPANPLSPVLLSDTQAYSHGVYTLSGNVVITSGLKRVEADQITYDQTSGELTLTGHVFVASGVNQEQIHASHATYNLKTETGTFYEVTGSVGMKPRGPLPTSAALDPSLAGPGAQRLLYTTPNPFLFTGRMVVKSGPRTYDIYDGTITSCQLPRPDWLLSAGHFSVADDKARAHNSTFRLLKVPVLYLPYVTAPTDSEQRQSGFMIPSVGTYSKNGSKGVFFGEQFYITLGRSADLIVGADYYTSIGFGQNAAFRYRGAGLNFLTVRYNGVLDRRTGILNQGGEDIVLAGRRDFTAHTRAAANIEYLSSYIFREAFTDNFNQAVNSDIVSSGYITHESNGVELAGEADRYQGIKLIAQGSTPQQQVRIFHAPAFYANVAERQLGRTPLLFSLESSATGLKRTQPNFATGGLVERVDVHPEVALPLHFAGFNLFAAVAGRETAYTRSRQDPVRNQAPQESLSGLSRADLDFSANLRLPVLERTFTPHGAVARVLGSKVRHTIEPELTYRLTRGIGNFANVLRFDDVDVQSDTHELEYGVTQRLFRRTRSTKPCLTDADFDAGLNPAQADQPSFPDQSLTSTPKAEGAPELARTVTPTPSSDLSSQPQDLSSQLQDLSSFGEAGGSASAVVVAPTTQPKAPGAPSIAPHAMSGMNATNNCQREELVSWHVAQKHFFDPTFGNAIQNGRRNIFTTTLDFSGVAFLTEPRSTSPVISRLRVRTSASTDVEWDFDLDTGATKFTSSNLFVDLHRGRAFSALSYARLDAPGRFYTQGSDNTTSTTTGVSTAISDFNQLRFLIGYGNPAQAGFSIAANTGLDLKSLYGATATNTTAAGNIAGNTVYPALFQYAAVQTSYNWNCCGLAVEYRKFELGSVRNENSYRFNFTLANLVTAGNLRRAERLF